MTHYGPFQPDPFCGSEYFHEFHVTAVSLAGSLALSQLKEAVAAQAFAAVPSQPAQHTASKAGQTSGLPSPCCEPLTLLFVISN